MIYFCIPAYNEERTVGVVLWKLRQVMAELQRDYQIIVVDDASTDSTPAVLSPYIRVLPLTVIRNSERRGYADSLELAVREALRRSPYPKRDAVVTLQADFTEDPDVVPAMMKRFEAGADLVATEVETEATAPRAVRWGRRFMRWLLRKQEWSTVGDPLSGLRVYRVVVLKRAVEARGTGRLVSHESWGANVELLAQTVPHSRRNDVVETTLKEHRLQRESRFSFMHLLRDVRAAAAGRISPHARALPVDSVVAQPLPIATEPLQPPERHHRRGARDTTQRKQRRDRADRPARREHRASREQPQPRARTRDPRPARDPRQARTPRPEVPPATATPIATPPAEAAASADAVKKRRKRRPRRRKQQAQDSATATPTLVVEPTDAAPVEAEAGGEQPAADGQPRKKSRRGRRGGRGRRRGTKANGTNGENTGTIDSGEAPPPVAAEGD